ncbi:unnamed protein product [Prorocentrum cordatum]|nr:unnamed protein product [Polarella glacialis]
MWARRCGVPPKWPSRVKVTLMSLGTLAIGVAVYQLLSGDDVAYLDLNNPSSNDVLCLNRWPLRDENPLNVLRGEQWEEWVSYRFNEVDFIERQCALSRS